MATPSNIEQSLTGEIAVVTGGSGMLGSRFVQALHAHGARVVSLDVRGNPSESPAFNILCDVTHESEVQTAFARIAQEVGTPSILINNAGRDVRPDAPPSESGPFEDYPGYAWQNILESHLTGALLVSQAYFRHYRAARLVHGSIVNIASVYGIVAPDQSIYAYRTAKRQEPFFKPVAYTVAKAGLIGFTKWLAEYGAPLGVRVNAIAPGGVLAGQDTSFVEAYAQRTMLGRMGDPDDCIGALLLLASGAGSYITGTTIVVDGGLSAR